MKKFRTLFAIVLSSLIFNHTSKAAVSSQEYLTPADTMTMRATTAPCYKLQKRGNSNTLARIAVEGDECPSNTSSLPRRSDRPALGAEPDSQGQPFQQRME